MLKRLLAAITAVFCLMCFLMVHPVSLAEDDEDDDFDMDDDFDFDDGGVMEDFSDVTGFEERNFNRECGDYTYQLTPDESAAFTVGYHGSDLDVVVPDQLDGYPVVAIGDFTFNFKDRIESVTLPEGISAIGNMAFFKCEKLKSVVIPEGVTMLDRCCFGGCVSLEDVTVPDSVQVVGEFAFLGCTSLKEIAFGDELLVIGPSAFQLCSSLSRVCLPQAAQIGPDAFTDCSPALEIVNE